MKQEEVTARISTPSGEVLRSESCLLIRRDKKLAELLRKQVRLF